MVFNNRIDIYVDLLKEFVDDVLNALFNWTVS